MINLETVGDRSFIIDSLTELSQLKNQILELPDFGVLQLSLKRAAELMSLEVFTSGDLEIDFEPQGWIDIHDESLIAALEPFTNDYLGLLKNAIDLGRLLPTAIKRDLDESINEDKTFVELTSLENWLKEREFHPGDIFQEYFDQELDISIKITDEIIWLRSKSCRDGDETKHSKVSTSKISDASTIEELRSAYQSLQLENERLKLKLKSSASAAPPRNEAPVAPRHRKTLLILIAALCEAAKVDPQARGSAQRIEKLTEKLGARVDDETIRKILVDVPDAVDSRRA